MITVSQRLSTNYIIAIISALVTVGQYPKKLNYIRYVPVQSRHIALIRRSGFLKLESN